MKTIIQTTQAPAAIGTYSQAVKVNQTVYISGQIPLNPHTMIVISTDFREQVKQAFENLKAVVTASGGNLSHIVKLTIFLIDMNQFAIVNEIMAAYFQIPYPARAVVEISRLPKDVLIEMDAIAVLDV